MLRIITVILLVAVLAIGMAFTGCASDVDSTNDSSVSSGGPPARGKLAPDFELKNLDGDTVSLKGLRGKYVMLNFWATWCGPCRAEMPYIEDLYRDTKWSDRGLVILAVNIGESASQARSFAEQYGLTFTILLDSSQRVGMMYNARLIPTTYFIDKDGIIRDIKIGAFPGKAQIELILERLIED